MRYTTYLMGYHLAALQIARHLVINGMQHVCQSEARHVSLQFFPKVCVSATSRSCPRQVTWTTLDSVVTVEAFCLVKQVLVCRLWF